MRRLKRILQILRSRGLDNYLQKVITLLIHTRLRNFKSIKHFFEGQCGIEIGGPSSVFQKKGFIPLYNIVRELDGCNFWHKTIWEGTIVGGSNYNYQKGKTGKQFISEATNLSFITSPTYDFLISSNCLEHVANPLKALEEWIRVVKTGGVIVLVLPNKDYNFDHKRPFTAFSHLLSDYQNNIQEDDFTHLDEVLEFHDLNVNRTGETLQQFKARCLMNLENRSMHHHIFNLELLNDMFNYFKLEILLAEGGYEYSIVGRKLL